MVKRWREGRGLGGQLFASLRCAPDAAAIVLDTMEGFFDLYAGNLYPFRFVKQEFLALRSCCVHLLEALIKLKVEIRPEVRERARNLASEWKGKVSVEADNSIEALGFLNLLVAYGLVDCCNTEELLDLATLAVKHKQAIILCRAMGLEDKNSDLILKLISKGKQLLAIECSFELELTKKFPPVLLFKDYLDSKKLAPKVGKSRKISLRSLNKARIEEVLELKEMIRYIASTSLNVSCRRRTF